MDFIDKFPTNTSPERMSKILANDIVVHTLTAIQKHSSEITNTIQDGNQITTIQFSPESIQKMIPITNIAWRFFQTRTVCNMARLRVQQYFEKSKHTICIAKIDCYDAAKTKNPADINIQIIKYTNKEQFIKDSKIHHQTF